MALGCLSYVLQSCRQCGQGEVGKGAFFTLVGLVLLHQLVSLYQGGIAITVGLTLLRPMPDPFQRYHVLPKERGYVPSLAKIRRATFVLGTEVRREKNELALGMLVVGTAEGLISGLRRQLESILTFSSGDPLHLIVVTDNKSRLFVAEKLSDIVGRFVAVAVILSPEWRWRRQRAAPRVKASFVDLEEVVTVRADFVDALQSMSLPKDTENDKYSASLFYVSPLYPQAFPNLDRMMFLDSSDLQWRDNVVLLWKQFDVMEEDEEKAFGAGLDMSPHYRSFLQQNYTKIHPESSLGLPGPLQGVNTGVTLFHLARLRANKRFFSMLEPAQVFSLVQKYGFLLSLGDQDWWTLLSWHLPSLFHILPCKFNLQSSVQYLHPPWEKTFSEYHSCNKTSAVVVHRNGCGPTPELCGYHPPPNSTYWQGRPSHLYDITIDTELFFKVMADKDKYMKRGRQKFL